MAVQMISETEHEPRLRLVPTQPEIQPERPETPAQPPRPIFPAREIMSVIEVLLRVLGLRILLAAAFGAMAYLGYLTVSEPTPTKIVAMAMWALLAFLPLVFLVARKG